MTVALMLLTLSVARQRGDGRRHEQDLDSGRVQSAPALNLDALRSAGL